MWGALSDERTGLSFNIAAGPSPEQSFSGPSLAGLTHDHILLSQIRGSPNPEGQVPVCISPRNTVGEF
jgi:hypothetical protein